ncbi:MAG: Farnesyl diphosphate synthase [Chlamydiae bacterium]|nr:Farnesyl diphosphate synthase [Chlamydiota bacterium]
MFSEILFKYRQHVEASIKGSVSSFGPKGVLRDAIEYALRNGGKRLRPAIVLMVADALGKRLDVSDAALSVEFFHTSSLIADDLPCMDDDDERRNCPALHKAFDEATALLATYALIAEGYARIGRNAKNEEVLSLALANAAHNAGILGLTGGQHLDLNPPQQLDESTVREAIAKKTGALFELSFVFGWLFGGGEPLSLPEVKKAAHHFGTIFQIVDDFADFAEDAANKRKVNYPAIVGVERAKSVLAQEFVDLKQVLESLELRSSEITAMVQFLEREAQEVGASCLGGSSLAGSGA